MALRTILFIISFSLALSVHSTDSDNKALGLTLEKKTIHIREKKTINTRPKAPSRQYVECYYGDGIIYISFAIPEGTATVSVKDLDTDNLQQDFLDTSSPAEIYIGEVSCGEITIETSDGKTYTGEITN